MKSVARVETPLMNRVACCANKAGLVGYDRECTRKLTQYRIRVNTIVPGVFETAMTAVARRCVKEISTLCNGQNGHRHLGALHILYQQQPTDLDRRFIEIRQWLTAEGEYLDHSTFAYLNIGMAQADLPSYSFVC